MDPTSNTEARTNDSDYTERRQINEARLLANAVANEDEDEGKEYGWVDCHLGYGEGFRGRHC